MPKAVNISVSVPVTIFREDGTYIAYTPVLDLSTSGKDVAEVRRRFSEVVIAFFEELLRKGTLNEVLASLGWKKVKKRWAPPTPVAHEMEEIQVPVAA